MTIDEAGAIITESLPDEKIVVVDHLGVIPNSGLVLIFEELTTEGAFYCSFSFGLYLFGQSISRVHGKSHSKLNEIYTTLRQVSLSSKHLMPPTGIKLISLDNGQLTYRLGLKIKEFKD